MEDSPTEDTPRFDGCDLADLARRYGTPLYLMSETHIRDRLGEIRRDFLGRYPGTEAVFASKAFQTLDMCRIVASEGIGLDAVSGGELYAALKAGVDPDRIVFHGNSKTIAELVMAVECSVGRVVSDSLYEIRELDRIAGEKGRRVRVLYRITPGVDSHTHRFISTGQLDSKFGIPLDAEVFGSYMRAVLAAGNLDFAGFHFHVGSQLLDNESHLKALGILLDIVERVRREFGIEVAELNLGGGFGVRYAEDEVRQPLRYFVDPMMADIASRYAAWRLPIPKVTIEPGRWIVGEAGMTLYTIGSVKTIPGVRTYVGIDGGMPDNPRPMLYDAKYRAFIVNKAGLPKDSIVTVAGKCCESGDILIRDLAVPSPESGDLLAVHSTGAYNYSMASNYNRIPRPPVVMLRAGSDRLAVRRETYEDILAREI
jgi:diaminopimelate decarboxylase